MPSSRLLPAALALALLSCAAGPAARPGAEALAAIAALEDRRSDGAGQLQAWTRPGSSPAVRQRALLALARLQLPTTAPDLVAALSDPDPSVREWAAFAAGQLGLSWVPLDEGVREALAAAALAAEAAEADLGARDAELEALGRLRTAAALARLSARLEAGSPLAARAARALGVGVKSGGPMPPGGVERLAALTTAGLGEAEAPAAAPAVRFGAAWALVQARAPAAVAALASCTRDPSAEVRAICAKGLGEHGGPGEVQALRRLLVEEDSLAAAEAARALARLAGRCPAARCEALDALGALSGWVARLGARPGAGQPLLALAQAALPPAAGALLAQLRLALRPRLAEPDPANLDCRLAAAQVRLQGTLDPLEGCGGGQVDEARRLALGLRELAQAAPPASPPARAALVLPFLARPEPRVRLAAVEALAALKEPSTAGPLLALLEAPDPVLAAAAAGALGALGARQAVEPVRALARREAGNADVAPALAEALGALKAPEAVPEVQAWLRHPNVTVRTAAAEALQALTGHPVEVPRVEAPFAGPPPPPLPPGAALVLETAKGAITIALAAADAPRTAANLAALAGRGYLDGLTFHRVVPDFVAQGGDPRGDGEGGPGYQVRCEVNRRPYRRGAVGMALSGKDTGGSQFFLTLAPQPHLEGRYTVFGEVTAGLEVADALLEGDVILRARVLPAEPPPR